MVKYTIVALGFITTLAGPVYSSKYEVVSASDALHRQGAFSPEVDSVEVIASMNWQVPDNAPAVTTKVNLSSRKKLKFHYSEQPPAEVTTLLASNPATLELVEKYFNDPCINFNMPIPGGLCVSFDTFKSVLATETPEELVGLSLGRHQSLLDILRSADVKELLIKNFKTRGGVTSKRSNQRQKFEVIYAGWREQQDQEG
jgi:hypothetical protein